MSPQTFRYLNLSVGTLINALANRASLMVQLEKIFKLQESITVSFDSTAVMESPLAFQAMYDHREKQIVLNQHFVNRAPEPQHVETFLIVHELFHALENTPLNPQLKAEHENRADQLAILAVIGPHTDLSQFGIKYDRDSQPNLL